MTFARGALGGAAVALAAAACFAGSLAGGFPNWTSAPHGDGDTVCRIVPGADAGPGAAVCVPSDATVVLCDERGVALDPQPVLTVSPNFGTPSSKIVVLLSEGGPFPVGARVRFSRLLQSSGVRPPRASWGR
jgi:hypothetical protein